MRAYITPLAGTQDFSDRIVAVHRYNHLQTFAGKHETMPRTKRRRNSPKKRTNAPLQATAPATQNNSREEMITEITPAGQEMKIF